MTKYLSHTMRTLLLAGTAIVAAVPAQAAALYFDFNQNLNNPNASVFLFGDAGQQASVSSLSGFNAAVTLNADGFFNLSLPNSLQQSGTGVRSTGLKVDSLKPIAGYFINRASATTDMTYILDEGALGKDYIVSSQGGGFGEGSQVAIHAIADNTNITFTPKGAGAINVTLQAGETYKYAGGGTNLTGSRVVSDKNVSVSAGHACAQVPVGVVACDTLIEQMIPTVNLSTNYYLSASEGASIAANRSDLVRIVATEDNTEVKVNGVPVATLNTGDFHELLLGAGNGMQVEASAKVLVAQYLTGAGSGGGAKNTDPAMSLVPGADTWLDTYRLATPTGAQQFIVNYASIVIDTLQLATLMLDGILVDTSGFSAIGATGFSRGIVDLPLGLFDLTAGDEFLVMIGGGGNYDSYFTYGGATFAPGISPPDPKPDAVPEPATLGLLGMGLAGLRLAGRRRKH